MVYALNVFNLIPGKENDYRDYSVKAGKMIFGRGGRIAASGWKPIRNLHGDVERRHMIVVEFPSEAVFQSFLDEADKADIHHMRENSCTDYIWTLYEPWDMRAWVKEGK